MFYKQNGVPINFVLNVLSNPKESVQMLPSWIYKWLATLFEFGGYDRKDKKTGQKSTKMSSCVLHLVWTLKDWDFLMSSNKEKRSKQEIKTL